MIKITYSNEELEKIRAVGFSGKYREYVSNRCAMLYFREYDNIELLNQKLSEIEFSKTNENHFKLGDGFYRLERIVFFGKYAVNTVDKFFKRYTLLRKRLSNCYSKIEALIFKGKFYNFEQVDQIKRTLSDESLKIFHSSEFRQSEKLNEKMKENEEDMEKLFSAVLLLSTKPKEFGSLQVSNSASPP